LKELNNLKKKEKNRREKAERHNLKEINLHIPVKGY